MGHISQKGINRLHRRRSVRYADVHMQSGDEQPPHRELHALENILIAGIAAYVGIAPAGEGMGTHRYQPHVQFPGSLPNLGDAAGQVPAHLGYIAADAGVDLDERIEKFTLYAGITPAGGQDRLRAIGQIEALQVHQEQLGLDTDGRASRAIEAGMRRIACHVCRSGGCSLSR